MITTIPDIKKALGIVGWMSEVELAWLAEQAWSHSRIVEVGSHLGRSTRALADNTPGWVLAFDDWQGPRDDLSLLDEQGTVLCQSHPIWNAPALFANFQRNCKDLLESGKLRILKGSHEDCSIIPPEFLRGPDEEKPDMVFIDGNHEFASVQRDIFMWSARLAKGGLLCGHDISQAGVFAAVVNCGKEWEAIPNADIWRMYV